MNNNSTALRCRLLNKFLFALASVVVINCFNLSIAVAKEREDSDISQEEIIKYKEVSEAANQNRVDKAASEDKTGNDPRVFSNKWMPYYRSTELDNGMTQQDLTACGTMGFSERVGMFYEIPLAQYRDLSDVSGFAPGTDAIGMGDIDLKFLWRPESTDWTFGEGGKKSGSVDIRDRFRFTHRR